MNLKLLNEFLEAQKVNQVNLAEQIGISRTALWRKLKGESEFTAAEINIMQNYLRMTNEECLAIFFNK